jgi:hypothetical protein
MAGAYGKLRLGKTRLEVTPICFGASSLGELPMTYGCAVDDGDMEGMKGLAGALPAEQPAGSL